MIKKLRKSFIITAMISVIAVLVVIAAVMNTLNFMNSDNEADVLLDLLAENGGSFAHIQRDSGEKPPDKPDGDNSPQPPADIREPWRRINDRSLITAETPYETRFFTVTLKDDCSLIAIDTSKIAAVESEDALTMARRLYMGGTVTGYDGTFKYLVQRETDNNLCIFVDRSRALRSVADFLRNSLLVMLGAIAGIFVLVFIFSGMVIKPVAESYEKQKKFITDAGHELKTPLTVINTCTEVIEMEQGESKWTKGITAQTERLAELTKELVTLARMDENAAQTEHETFSLSETLAEILDPFAMIAEHRDIGFKAGIQPDITYKGDKSLIAKLCSILADNAVKYTPDGGSINFTLTRKGKRITLISENSSEPMEKGAHPEFFDRFRRGDSSHSSDIPGYGIGLAMAQSVVQAHGGRIDAVSRDGQSLTITVKL